MRALVELGSWRRMVEEHPEAVGSLGLQVLAMFDKNAGGFALWGEGAPATLRGTYLALRVMAMIRSDASTAPGGAKDNMGVLRFVHSCQHADASLSDAPLARAGSIARMGYFDASGTRRETAAGMWIYAWLRAHPTVYDNALSFMQGGAVGGEDRLGYAQALAEVALDHPTFPLGRPLPIVWALGSLGYVLAAAGLYVLYRPQLVAAGAPDLLSRDVAWVVPALVGAGAVHGVMGPRAGLAASVVVDMAILALVAQCHLRFTTSALNRAQFYWHVAVSMAALGGLVYLGRAQVRICPALLRDCAATDTRLPSAGDARVSVPVAPLLPRPLDGARRRRDGDAGHSVHEAARGRVQVLLRRLACVVGGEPCPGALAHGRSRRVWAHHAQRRAAPADVQHHGAGADPVAFCHAALGSSRRGARG